MDDAGVKRTVREACNLIVQTQPLQDYVAGAYVEGRK